jgi:hypothetical protein
MSYELTYELDYKRIISAVINDARNIIPQTKNQTGSVIYAYVQSQIMLVNPNVLMYRIESDQGNLAGYVGIRVNNGIATQVLYQLRPAFNDLEISGVITNFIQTNSFLKDSIY